MVDDPVPLSELRRALVIKLRHHGDVLLSSPVFSVLKNHAPQLEIDALVYADTAPMLTLHPAISEVHCIDRGWKKAGLMRQMSAELALLSKLRGRRYDLIVHLTDHPRGAWLTRLLGARWSVAPQANDKGRFWRSSFTHLYAQARKRHTVELHLDALRRIGTYPSTGERRLVLTPGAEAEQRVSTLLQQHGLAENQFIHIHPGSRWFFKCWPTDKTAALLDALHKAGLQVVLTAAPEARELELIENILAQTHSPLINLAGQLTLKELAALTARARLFAGVDSAPMHIAAAMQTPTVVLFGPSGESYWAPWQVQHRIITSNVHTCRPCGQAGCGGGKVSECLTTLPVERVLGAINELLST